MTSTQAASELHALAGYVVQIRLAETATARKALTEISKEGTR